MPETDIVERLGKADCECDEWRDFVCVNCAGFKEITALRAELDSYKLAADTEAKAGDKARAENARLRNALKNIQTLLDIDKDGEDAELTFHNIEVTTQAALQEGE